MACLDVPVPPIPIPLPPGFSIPPLPAFSVQAGVCCQSVGLALVPPPASLGPLNPAFLIAVRAAVKTFQDFIDSIEFECPRNG